MSQFKISLKAARVNANMEQREAAKKLGITVETLRNYETGKTSPTMGMATRMCALYKIPQEFVNFVCS